MDFPYETAVMDLMTRGRATLVVDRDPEAASPRGRSFLDGRATELYIWREGVPSPDGLGDFATPTAFLSGALRECYRNVGALLTAAARADGRRHADALRELAASAQGGTGDGHATLAWAADALAAHPLLAYRAVSAKAALMPIFTHGGGTSAAVPGLPFPGQTGWGYMGPGRVRDAFGTTARDVARARRQVLAELAEWDEWRRGEAFSASVVAADGSVLRRVAGLSGFASPEDMVVAMAATLDVWFVGSAPADD